jgi:hypothetical protein
MPMLLRISILLVLFYFPTFTYAENTPSIQNPPHNSTTSDLSPKLEWTYNGTCPTDSNCFRVEVSENELFSGLEKSTYTNNTYYSPTLSLGKWFWRIKAKDEQNNWSEYVSSIFTIQENQNSNTPSPTLTSTTTSSPQTSDKTSAEFIISSSITNFTADTIAKAEIKITKLQPNTDYFLKTAFFKEGKTNYFGKTKVEERWIKNNGTYSDQYKITTNSEGNWYGNIEIQIDTEDSGFEQSGSYLLKIGRYNSSGSGPTWSNFLSVTIQAEKASNKKEESSTLNDNTLIESIQNVDPNIDSQNSTVIQTTPSPHSSITYSLPNLESSVAGESTYSGQTQVLGEKRANWWFVSAGLLLLLLTPILIVYTRKKRYYQS